MATPLEEARDNLLQVMADAIRELLAPNGTSTTNALWAAQLDFEAARKNSVGVRT